MNKDQIKNLIAVEQARITAQLIVKDGQVYIPAQWLNPLHWAVGLARTVQRGWVIAAALDR